MFYPGYVLVEMDMERSCLARGEIHAAPSPDSSARGNSPTPLSEEEVQHIVYKAPTAREKPKLSRSSSKKNETRSRITEGHSPDFTGIVDEKVNEDREDIESHGHDFRPFHPGGVGVQPGGEGRRSSVVTFSAKLNSLEPCGSDKTEEICPRWSIPGAAFSRIHRERLGAQVVAAHGIPRDSMLDH